MYHILSIPLRQGSLETVPHVYWLDWKPESLQEVIGVHGLPRACYKVLGSGL